MKTDSIAFDKQIYYRLIALWVLCEAVLGGMMHAVKIPFTGIVVSSGAVICICLIAYYVPVKGAILKATIIVAIFKMMLSPHTPPTAYVAVFFQGLMGQILFFNLRFFRLSCILLAVLALVESAVQRIIVVTVLYGSSFWKALNEFIRKVTGETSVTNYSLAVATGYVIMHAFIGLLVGVFAGSIVWQSRSWSILHREYLIPQTNEEQSEIKPYSAKRKKKIQYLFIFIWIGLIILFLQSYLHIGKPLIPPQVPLQILLRSLLIILTWYFLLSPLLSSLIKKWLSGQQIKSQSDINQVVLMLPSVRNIFLKSWQLSSSAKGLKRLSVFCKIVLVNTLR
ncbi:MAG: hypothetical protein JWO92_1598 [Chitinophagaceae bacterium]|nr:hypothetical protein [Chitinophagaceae bacterium]MDB5224236.1 hypothetical protein [Chitinophagaceae bacterium]